MSTASLTEIKSSHRQSRRYWYKIGHLFQSNAEIVQSAAQIGTEIYAKVLSPMMLNSDSRQNRSIEDDWLSRLAHHRTGLALLSFGESTVLPIPLETLVAPLMIGHPRRSLAIAAAIWIGCLLGATLFYFLGLWLVDPVVLPALEMLGLRSELESMLGRLNDEGLFWTVFLVSLLPAPMQFATLGAGAVKGNFLVFTAAIALSRGIRYFGLALLAQIIGERIASVNVPKRYLILGMMLVLLAGWIIWQGI